MECFGGDVNKMVCGMGWSGVVGLDRVMGGWGKMLSCDWGCDWVGVKL